MELKFGNPLAKVVQIQGWGVNGEWYRAHGVNILGHNGLDFRVKHGEAIYAVHDGVALYQVDGNQGHGVVVITNEPYDYNGGQSYFKTIFWHMCDPIKEPQYKSPIADKGAMVVKKGDVIGYADSTGFSTMDHLHFALKPVVKGENLWTWGPLEALNGYGGCIDPTPYFEDETLLIAELEVKVGLYKQIIMLYQRIKELTLKKTTPSL